MIPTSQTYRDRLHPWCVIRHLPNLQRLTVARFRRRNDAVAHLQLVQQLIPTDSYAVIFDAIVNDEDN
ncbi:hypothetical protein [Coleofasciculus sp. H7-2]|uniref:hypothetical protein n=1 Tax=Coleofasciculus sp. H7-2 TaxID=3351545 RepID=UPI00366C5919